MKIGIANDSPVAVEALRRALAHRPQHDIAWIATNGQNAVEQATWQRPELILMDLQMPVMGGVEATRIIMSTIPCAILVVTFDVGTNASLVFDAMAAGAIDAVDMPNGSRELIGTTVMMLAKIDAIEAQILQAANDPSTVAAPLLRAPAISQGEKLVVIGASAGGPAALATLLSGIPSDFRSAIIIVQHLDAQFADGLAQWLNNQVSIPVRLAVEGDQPEAGVALIAGTDRHLYCRSKHVLGYTSNPENLAHRPSIDVLFSSVAQWWGKDAIGVILTGMGKDGAAGLLELKRCGGETIAQDQASSTVFGMPQAAIKLEAVQYILPLAQIAGHLCGGAFAPAISTGSLN